MQHKQRSKGGEERTVKGDRAGSSGLPYDDDKCQSLTFFKSLPWATSPELQPQSLIFQGQIWRRELTQVQRESCIREKDLKKPLLKQH